MNVYEGLLLREAFLRKEVIELRFSKEIEKVTQWSIICLPSGLAFLTLPFPQLLRPVLATVSGQGTCFWNHPTLLPAAAVILGIC